MNVDGLGGSECDGSVAASCCKLMLQCLVICMATCRHDSFHAKPQSSNGTELKREQSELVLIRVLA